jgi:CRP-like cAMP-binding protein
VQPDRLAQLPLFASLPEEQRWHLALWAEELTVEVGHRLLRQGDEAYEFFAILEGEVDVLRDDRRLARLGPGDFFGELALLEDERRGASVVAAGPLRVVTMTKREFLFVVERMPEVAEQIRAAVRARRGPAEAGQEAPSP